MKLKILALCSVLASQLLSWSQSVPPLVNYQGKLTDASGNPLASGEYTLSFSIYDSEAGGQRVWGPQIFGGSTGPGLGSKVPVVQGYFNVILGQIDTNRNNILDAFNAPNRFVEIQVGSNPPIKPRQQILSAPFALQAGKAVVASQSLIADVSKSSENSQKLNGVGWEAVLSSPSPAAGFILPAKLQDNSIPGTKLQLGSVTKEQLASSIQFNDPRSDLFAKAVIRTLPMTIDAQLNGPLADDGTQVKADLQLLKALVADQWSTTAYSKYSNLLAIVEQGIGKVAPANMVFIPGRVYHLGNSFSDLGEAFERPVHDTELSPFFIDRTEVTDKLWLNVKNWAQANNKGYQLDPSPANDDLPMILVSWFEAVRWCNARSEMEGLMPVYYLDETPGFKALYRSGDASLLPNNVNWKANGYRLPTEAEWEAAARGGLTDKLYPWGDEETTGRANDGGSILNVGSFPAYGFGAGLFDMAGNVSEWCFDIVKISYYADLLSEAKASSAPIRNPKGPLNGDWGDSRVYKGGSVRFPNNPFYFRCSAKNFSPPNGHDDRQGFRCVRSAL